MMRHLMNQWTNGVYEMAVIEQIENELDLISVQRRAHQREFSNLTVIKDSERNIPLPYTEWKPKKRTKE